SESESSSRPCFLSRFCSPSKPVRIDPMSKSYRVAIVGATGAVGLKFIECIEQRKFPCSEVVLYASTKSEGKVLHVNGKPLRIVGLTPERVEAFDFAFFSAGSGISKEYAPL